MELVVHKINGEKTDRKIKMDDAIFGIEPNDHVIYLDAKQYMANQRQGTHSAKERNAIAGSRKKIKRQKGTGTARFGDIKNPLFRGGGRIFGPRPRNYGFKLNKKVKRLARLSALSYKAKDNNIIVLEDFSFEAPKTKQYLDILKAFNLAESRSLLVMPKADSNVILSARNLQKTKVVKADSLNTYDILNANTIIISENSVAEIEKTFAQ